MSYTKEIKYLAQSALDELNEALLQKKIPANPISEETFLCRWIAQAMKKQRFSSLVYEDLKRWTQQGRSMGKNAKLKEQLTAINKFYVHFFPNSDESAPIIKKQLDTFSALLRDENWMVHTEFEINRKVRVISEGQNSFAVCQKALSHAFDDNTLVKPLSLYFRGPEDWFIQKAYQEGLLLKKITHYKSIVKYHGEYQLWPNNHLDALAVIPKIS